MTGTVKTEPATHASKVAMVQASAEPIVEIFSARLIRREAERQAARDLATSTPAGLESALARISAEVTAEAADAKAAKS
jgi:hypothetical protein